jgi:hypothetical protein
VEGDRGYWADLSIKVKKYCEEHNIKHINYFYIEVLVKGKSARDKINAGSKSNIH